MSLVWLERMLINIYENSANTVHCLSKYINFGCCCILQGSKPSTSSGPVEKVNIEPPTANIKPMAGPSSTQSKQQPVSSHSCLDFRALSLLPIDFSISAYVLKIEAPAFLSVLLCILLLCACYVFVYFMQRIHIWLLACWAYHIFTGAPSVPFVKCF